MLVASSFLALLAAGVGAGSLIVQGRTDDDEDAGRADDAMADPPGRDDAGSAGLLSLDLVIDATGGLADRGPDPLQHLPFPPPSEAAAIHADIDAADGEPAEAAASSDPAGTVEAFGALGPAPVVTGFEAGIDRLILDFDPRSGPLPRITLDAAIEPGSTAILGDGHLIAMLRGTVDVPLADIVSTQGDEVETGPFGLAMTGGSDADETFVRTVFSLMPDTGDTDAVNGSDGADHMTDGAGHGTVYGGAGDDLIRGAGGHDELLGEAGRDWLDGGDGRDLLIGGGGSDSITGGNGGDAIFGGPGDDRLAGGEGDDFIQGGAGADTIWGGGGDDWIDGTYDAGDTGDRIDGGEGDDRILVAAGDHVTGGDGADEIVTRFAPGLGDTPFFADFDPVHDLIELLYDPEETPNPVVTLREFEDGSGAHVLLNGEPVLSVAGAQGLDPGAVELTAMPRD